MYDRKASDSFMGLTGAYCDLCTYSKSECVNRVVTRDFFSDQQESRFHEQHI